MPFFYLSGMLGSFEMQKECFAMKYTRLLALLVFPSLGFAEDKETVTPDIPFEFSSKPSTEDIEGWVDKEIALRIRKAAEQGHPVAQYQLAEMYNKGEGVLQDHKEAAKWYRKAAEQGHPGAQFNLAIKYYYGEGVLQDQKEAAKWYRKAAELGDAKSQFNLALMYDKGEGVLQDKKEAVKWFRKAAELGDAKSQFNLGVLYAKGSGVLKDFVTAYAWANLAAANGAGINLRDILSGDMTPDQIAEGQKLSREMVEKNPKLLGR
jgi:TPR repeat protein